MFIVAYDFSNNKRRSKFAKFMQEYGEKIQYSVYKVKHSPRVLRKIIAEIDNKYKKNFTKADSIYIFPVNEVNNKHIYRYGSAVHELEQVVNLGE